jgi:hypothetical protein
MLTYRSIYMQYIEPLPWVSFDKTETEKGAPHATEEGEGEKEEELDVNHESGGGNSGSGVGCGLDSGTHI